MKTFDMLVKEVQNSFNYCYEDAEEYAKYLKNTCLEEYKRQLQIEKSTLYIKRV